MLVLCIRCAGLTMELRFCRSCGKELRLGAKSRQFFCASAECQRERRRRWQQTKRKSDPDYKENQSSAQKAWAKRNSNYWSKYRSSHPNYRERNRKFQQERNRKRNSDSIAKMDTNRQNSQDLSGLYLMTPLKDGIAKMDTLIVEIKVISRSSNDPDAS
jgi:hypothetical protein